MLRKRFVKRRLRNNSVYNINDIFCFHKAYSTLTIIPHGHVWAADEGYIDIGQGAVVGYLVVNSVILNAIPSGGQVNVTVNVFPVVEAAHVIVNTSPSVVEYCVPASLTIAFSNSHCYTDAQDLNKTVWNFELIKWCGWYMMLFCVKKYT